MPTASSLSGGIAALQNSGSNMLSAECIYTFLAALLTLHRPPRLNGLAWFFRQMGDEPRALACETKVRQTRLERGA